MIHSRRILQSALRHIPTQTRAWRQPARNVSTAAPALPNASRQPSRWTRRLIYAGIFGALGLGAGNYMDRLMFEPPFLPGSPDDKAMLADIQLMSDGLPIVQALRNNPDYVEKDVYEHFSDEHKSHRLTSGPLAGSGRLAFQKVFWNEKEKANVSVVYFGHGLEGWPHMVHGGAVATVIDENLGRIAIRHFPERTGVTANLNVSYRNKTLSNGFYALHTSLDQEQSTDRKAYATCEMRDMSGQLCVEASGLFVVPKKLKLAKVGEHF